MISQSTSGTSTSNAGVTVEEAIHHRLIDFLDKRKASGDATPCGPHEMVPIYGGIFEIQVEELKDERFLSRLRRSGLRDSRSKEETTAMGKGEKYGKGQRKEKKSNRVTAIYLFQRTIH